MPKNNGSTTITYTPFGGAKQEMSISTSQAATFAARMVRQHAWLPDVSISDDDANTKFKEIMSKNPASNHIGAAPHLYQVAALAKRLETASSKRLITELEREQLLQHTLAAVKELGMSNGRAISILSRVWPAPAPAPADIQETAKVPVASTPAPAPEQRGGIFKR